MDKEWRCKRCNKLLGIIRDGRLSLRFARGHEYLVGLPATAVCRGCRALTELHSTNVIVTPHPESVTE